MSSRERFEAWHDKQNLPYESGAHCPHIEWERLAWQAAERATAHLCAEIAQGWATAETAATCANVADAIRRHYGLGERAK